MQTYSEPNNEPILRAEEMENFFNIADQILENSLQTFINKLNATPSFSNESALLPVDTANETKHLFILGVKTCFKADVARKIDICSLA